MNNWFIEIITNKEQFQNGYAEFTDDVIILNKKLQGIYNEFCKKIDSQRVYQKPTEAQNENIKKVDKLDDLINKYQQYWNEPLADNKHY